VNSTTDLRQLHKVLKDQTRSRLVELLQEKNQLSYTDLLHLSGVQHTGKLNYHLKILGDLISKDEQSGMYSLTEKGRLAAQLSSKFEVAASGPPTGVVVIGALLLLGGFGWAVGYGPALAALSNCSTSTGGCPGITGLYPIIFVAALLAFGFASAGTGVGMMIGRQWARKAGILVWVGYVFVYTGESFVAEIGQPGVSLFNPSSELTMTASVVIAASVIYYLTRPKVKRYFENGTFGPGTRPLGLKES